MCDLHERLKEHVPPAAKSVELPAAIKIKLHTDGSFQVTNFTCETLGERNEVEGAAECPGNIPYKELLGE